MVGLCPQVLLDLEVFIVPIFLICCFGRLLLLGLGISRFFLRPRCQIRPTTHAYPAYVFPSTATNGLTKEAACHLLNMSGVYGGVGGGGV